MLIFDSKDTKSQLNVFHYIVGNCIWEQACGTKFLFATLYIFIYAVSENERKREREAAWRVQENVFFIVPRNEGCFLYLTVSYNTAVQLGYLLISNDLSFRYEKEGGENTQCPISGFYKLK